MSFLVLVHTSQDFAQTQKNFARSHDRVTVTFKTLTAQLNYEDVFMYLLYRLDSTLGFRLYFIGLPSTI